MKLPNGWWTMIIWSLGIDWITLHLIFSGLFLENIMISWIYGLIWSEWSSSLFYCSLSSDLEIKTQKYSMKSKEMWRFGSTRTKREMNFLKPRTKMIEFLFNFLKKSWIITSRYCIRSMHSWIMKKKYFWEISKRLLMKFRPSKPKWQIWLFTLRIWLMKKCIFWTTGLSNTKTNYRKASKNIMFLFIPW